MSQVIRLARPEDRLAVESIVQAAYARYVPRIGREPGPMLDDYAARIRARQVHVLEDAGVIRGILVLVPQERAMLLDNVAVSPEAQGQGHGRTLLAFAERAAIDAGYDSVRLYTNEAMVENIALYSRIGFVETHRGQEQGLRRVYMAKALA
ncbi:MAG: GNAT family N-acetyltransferase [Acetobacteraceae bacterium]|nr:GNAT family N-acetyltransferase [Acetobacteraceae bacterium]